MTTELNQEWLDNLEFRLTGTKKGLEKQLAYFVRNNWAGSNAAEIIAIVKMISNRHKKAL